MIGLINKGFIQMTPDQIKEELTKIFSKIFALSGHPEIVWTAERQVFELLIKLHENKTT